MARSILCIILIIAFGANVFAQNPVVWVFGKDAGLDFNSGVPVPVSYPIDNCYSPSSSQCDAAGNLLFYCDGRDIKDRTGNVMTGSLNPVWPSPVHIGRKIVSDIVPVTNDTNRYFVFMLSPSSGVSPFGTYYNGALTYSIVDMRLNGGKGGIDPDFSNILLNTELDMDFIVVPAKNCGYWLIAYKRSGDSGQFATYLITGNGIAGPVYSTATIAGFPYNYHNMKLTYSYLYHKMVVVLSSVMLASFDFDYETGIVGNGHKLVNLSEFSSPGGGATWPSICLSPSEKYIYLLGYPVTGPDDPNIRLQQIPVDLSAATPAITGAPNTIFLTSDPTYQVPDADVHTLYYSQDCAIRKGPDDKVYVLYNTAMSFLGCINKPDLPGAACDFSPAGVSLLPNTYGSYYFPATEHKRPETKIGYKVHDTLLCFNEPFYVNPELNNPSYTYTWDDGSTGMHREITREGVYWVRSTGTCYEPQQVDTFIVRFEPAEKCHCEIFIPTAFTPNNDGINDFFRPLIPVNCLDGNYELSIYNRWGNTVFRSYNILKGWDGLQNGTQTDAGTYYYQVTYIDIQHRKNVYKGDITLLR